MYVGAVAAGVGEGGAEAEGAVAGVMVVGWGDVYVRLWMFGKRGAPEGSWDPGESVLSLEVV